MNSLYCFFSFSYSLTHSWKTTTITLLVHLTVTFLCLFFSLSIYAHVSQLSLLQCSCLYEHISYVNELTNAPKIQTWRKWCSPDNNNNKTNVTKINVGQNYNIYRKSYSIVALGTHMISPRAACTFTVFTSILQYFFLFHMRDRNNLNFGIYLE